MNLFQVDTLRGVKDALDVTCREKKNQQMAIQGIAK